jgi:hypothetical protein
MVLLFSSTLVIGAVTGFVFFTESQFFCGVAGQTLHGLLSIVCVSLVGVTLWRFGWMIGLIDLASVLIALNAGLSFCRYFRGRSGL